jgi:hypothetical protein
MTGLSRTIPRGRVIFFIVPGQAGTAATRDFLGSMSILTDALCPAACRNATASIASA